MWTKLGAVIALAAGLAWATPVQACSCNKSKSKSTAKKSDKAPKSAAKVVLVVEGMTCGGCAKRVSGALQKLGGVYAANVNLSTKKVTVRYAPKKVTVSKLVSAINALGYKARRS